MQFTPQWRLICCVLIVVILLWLATPFIVKHLYPALAERGQFGDLFGSVNALFSGLAFGFVVIALILQNKELRQQAAHIQSQLDLTRDEFHASHRPKVRLKHLVLARNVQPGQPIVVELTFVNTGTADARLGEVGIRFLVLQTGDTLPNAQKIPSIYDFRDTEKLVCGVNTQIECDTGFKLRQEEFDFIQKSRFKLYCIGWTSYRDKAGRLRITGFCRILEGDLSDAYHARFCKFDDTDYEYED